MYNVPEVASVATTMSGAPVDRMTCQIASKEEVRYHTHTHVAVFVDGKMMKLPGGIGITAPPLIVNYPSGRFYDVGATDCLYWSHTHAADGVIHVEAPVKRVVTLGQFFDVWNQALSSIRVGDHMGHVVVFENGRRLTGNPRLTPLLNQGDIQIDVGTPLVPYTPFKFNVTGGCGAGTLSCALPKS